VASVYFDTSIFLAIFNKEASGPQIKSLLRELRRDKVKIYTSVITIQEVSVLSFRKGVPADENHAKVSKLARIQGITKDIALTAAKLEAQLKDAQEKAQAQQKAQQKAQEKAQQKAGGSLSAEHIEDNRRRKWDCFHIATAMCLRCATLYAEDAKLLKRKEHLDIKALEFEEPRPKKPELFPPKTE